MRPGVALAVVSPNRDPQLRPLAPSAIRWHRATTRLQLPRTDDEEGDRDVLAADGNQGEDVEELVVTEHGRHRVRPAASVDQGAGGVDEAADAEESYAARVEVGRELRQSRYSGPAERDSERYGQPLWCAYPDELEDGCRGGARPDGRQHDQAPVAA